MAKKQLIAVFEAKFYEKSRRNREIKINQKKYLQNLNK
jgi:hypothetical protein